MPGQVGSWAGLLVDWRRQDDGQWWGQVVYAVPRDVGVSVVDTWVQAAYLRQVDPPPVPPADQPRRFPG